MSFIDLTKNYIELVYWNIDQLLNFFDLDNISLISTRFNTFLVNNNYILNTKNIITKFFDFNFYFYYPIIESFKYLLIEILKGKWIINFVNITKMVPTMANLIIQEKCFFDSQYTNNLNILHLPVYHDNKFFIGFLNGLILSLPFSCNQLIIFYRYIINGPSFSFIASLGWVFGQCSLLICLLFGIRPIIIQWFSLEPLNYILGLYLIILFIYNIIQRKKLKQDPEKVFMMHFLLTWTENIIFFRYIDNLNFGIEANLLTVFSSFNTLEYILLHGSYIIGIFFGCLFFSYVYKRIFLKFCKNLFYLCYRSCDEFINFVSFTLLILIMTLLISSFSYYSIGYIITNSLGFVPQDKLLSSILLNTNSKDPRKEGFGILENKRTHFMYIDISSLEGKDYKSSLQFENLNYHAEYAWVSKIDKLVMPRTLTNYKDKKVYIDANMQMSSSLPLNYVFDSQLIIKNINDIFINNNRTRLYIDNLYTQLNRNYDLFKSLVDTYFKDTHLPFDIYNLLPENVNKISKMNARKNNELEIEIKQKYYTGYIYKILLNFDIDNFISRHPKMLLEFQDKEIFERRTSLSSYYESNRYYSTLNNFIVFRNLFFNSKSYSNNIYNNQFIGTLNIVKRLFQITLNDNKNNRNILKFDYPQIILDSSDSNVFLHEELQYDKNILSNNYKGLLPTINSPLYIGWNEKLNQLVLTNDFLLKSNQFNITEKYNDTHNVFNNGFYFTSLPVVNLQQLNNLIRNSYSISKVTLLKHKFLDRVDISDGKIESFDLQNIDPIHFYKTKVLTTNEVDNGGLNWSDTFNWYSFRYSLRFPKSLRR